MKPEEVKLAQQVIGTFEGDVDLQEYRDEYQDGLREIIDAKIEGREVVAPEVEAPPKVVNLMDALRKSLDTVSAEEEAGGRRAWPRREEAAAGVGAMQGLGIRALGIGYEKSICDQRVAVVASLALAAPLRRADARGDGRGLLLVRDARRSAFLARRLDDRLRRHDRRSEAEPPAQRRSGRARRRLARADGADDGAAVVEQPALESRRQGDRVPVGAADAGDAATTRRARRSGCCRSAAASRGASPTC